MSIAIQVLESYEARVCFICHAPGPCKHREFPVEAAHVGQRRVERDRGPVLEMRRPPYKLQPGELHWAALLIAKVHQADDSACACQTCVAVRTAKDGAEAVAAGGEQ